MFQHARGCLPWRPAADMGTAWYEILKMRPFVIKYSCLNISNFEFPKL